MNEADAAQLVTAARRVAGAWGWDNASVAPLAGGLINATFAVRAGDRNVAVLQRLHPIFAPEVNLDVEVVTEHVFANGLVTPRLVVTRDGQRWVMDQGHCWRALSFVDGLTVHRVPGPEWARSAGAFIGRWHAALDDLRHDYNFARAGVHDTQAHLGRLRDAAAHWRSRAVDDDSTTACQDASDLAAQIAAAVAEFPEVPNIAPRHCHGDLKISNLLFAPATDAAAVPSAHCLVDLDTVGVGTLTFELGDALRSWCNPAGEDVAAPAIDLAVFGAAMAGYTETAGQRSDDERRAIVAGLEIVCFELAARFCVDVFDDRYFGWDASRFPSRRAHNLVRARGQLALGHSVRHARTELMSLTSSKG